MVIKEIASVKKANTPPDIISNEEYERRIREIVKCKKDIVYFANTYFKILTMNEGIRTIKLYPKQEELLRFFKDDKRCVVLSARQSSKTTTYTIFLLWSTIFFPEKKCMILANKAATAVEIVSRIQLGYEYLPEWIKPRVLVWNKGQILFANKSEIRGFASSSDAARGFSAQIVALDEFAFLQKNIADKLFTSIYPVISTAKEGKMIIVSTPNGTADNLYYDIWQQANSKTKNEEGWKPFEMHWWDVPGRDEKFKEMTIASIGQKRWDQEFACEFLSPSDFRRLIPEDILEKYKMRLDQYKLQDEAKGREMQIVSQDESKVYNFTMWECFNQKHTYLASGDVAEGTGRDQSVLQIWDVTDLSKIELVCKFADNNVSVLEFAYVSSKMLELYANPPLIVENNSIGIGYIDVLRINYAYPNIVHEGSNNNPWGIRAHATVKPKACLWLRDMFTTQGFEWIIKDSDLLKEIGTFVKKESSSPLASYAAMGNAHDDLVMSLVWAAYLLQPSIVERYYIVIEYFTSSLGVIYPKKLAPGIDYTIEDLKKIYDSPYYKEFQDTIVEKRKQRKEDEETKKELIKKERELKNLERKIAATDYRRTIEDPFNPNVQRQNEEENNYKPLGLSTPGYMVGGGADSFLWDDEDDTGTWGNPWNGSRR